MFKKIKIFIEAILTSKIVYNFFVRPSIKNGFIKIKNNFLYVSGQSPYLHSLLFWGIYERREIKLINKYLIRDLTVVELGASLGLTTASICSLAKKGTNIYSVEANPKLIGFLNKTKEKNNFTHLTIISAAVDYSNKQKIEFALDERNLSSHKGTSKNSVFVDTIKLKDIITTNIIGKYSLICDIEGAEVEMLINEDENLIIDNCQLIIMELHETEYNQKKYEIDEIRRLVCKKFSMICVETIGSISVFKR